MTTTTVPARIAELEQNCGGLRAAARHVGIDVAYLWRLKHGRKNNPSDAVLIKLGLARLPAAYKPLTHNGNGDEK